MLFRKKLATKWSACGNLPERSGMFACEKLLMPGAMCLSRSCGFHFKAAALPVVVQFECLTASSVAAAFRCFHAGSDIRGRGPLPQRVRLLCAAIFERYCS